MMSTLQVVKKFLLPMTDVWKRLIRANVNFEGAKKTVHLQQTQDAIRIFFVY